MEGKVRSIGSDCILRRHAEGPLLAIHQQWPAKYRKQGVVSVMNSRGRKKEQPSRAHFYRRNRRLASLDKDIVLLSHASLSKRAKNEAESSSPKSM